MDQVVCQLHGRYHANRQTDKNRRRNQTLTYHINDALVHINSDGQQKCEEQFVFFKERATHVRVETEGKVVVDVDDTLRNVVRSFRVRN